jgi:hypothetical protein
MSKFDYMNFSLGGYDTEFVAHAGKYTEEQVVNLCIQEEAGNLLPEREIDMRKIKIHETRSKIAEINKLGISGQGEITIIKNVGHIGLAINGLQWELGSSDAGEITKAFNARFRIDDNGRVKEVEI